MENNLRLISVGALLDRIPCVKSLWFRAGVVFLAIATTPAVLPAREQEACREKGAPEPSLPAPRAVPCEASREDTAWERWEHVARKPSDLETNAVRLPARWMIRFFKKYISPVDGPSCTFSPSCSTYGMNAIHKHGIGMGLSMTAERVMRDHHPQNPARYPLKEGQDNLFYLDPVESNDFWWSDTP